MASRGKKFAPANSAQAAPPLEAKECAAKAEESFSAALTHYRSSDNVYCQAKCMARIVEMHLSRVFAEVAIRQVPIAEAASGQGLEALKAAESKAPGCLELAGDIGDPLLLILTLLNAAEVNWLQGRVLQCYQGWKEAAGTLSLIHLQRQEPERSVRRSWGENNPAPLSYKTPGSAPAVYTHSPPRTTGSLGLGGRGDPESRPGVDHLQRGNSRASVGSRDTGGLKAQGTPLRAPALPTVCHPPSVMLKIHGLLQRATRLAFVLSGPPPPHVSSVITNPLVAAALPNSTHLLAGWAMLDSWVQLYPSQEKAVHRRHHRRGGRRVTHAQDKQHSGQPVSRSGSPTRPGTTMGLGMPSPRLPSTVPTLITTVSEGSEISSSTSGNRPPTSDWVGGHR
ncbi:unnamed protein product [Choristocarpus tenellus]